MKKNEKYQHNEVGENWLYGIISDLEKAKAYARFGIDNDKQLIYVTKNPKIMVLLII